MSSSNSQPLPLSPRITVVGVGGAGNNALSIMMARHLQGVELVAANTDAQALRCSPVPHILQLGRDTTEGLGAGSRAEVGREAATGSRGEIERSLQGSDMCFIAAGMGGGTGTGAAPVIAEIARSMGMLTVAVVTKPFAFEGTRRARAADHGLEALAPHVDSLIVIPNQNLFRLISPSTTLRGAFALADEILYRGVRSISDLMVVPGLINLDFADVRTVLANTGRAKIGTGEAAGADRGQRAAMQALTDPLLDEEVAGARGLLVSIVGGDDLLLWEVDEAARHITDLVDADADIIWGSSHDPSLQGRMRVSIIAAGIGPNSARGDMPDTVEAAPVEIAPAPGPAPKESAGEEGSSPPPGAPPAAPNRAARRQPSLFERMAEAARSGQVHAVLAAEAAGRDTAASDRQRGLTVLTA
ncbi:MAG: cell division protein FtsZ [Alphaproteobacteria bacterium]|nr:cell division protein FtsZ [Alphaproteobacteria bacterium]